MHAVAWAGSLLIPGALARLSSALQTQLLPEDSFIRASNVSQTNSFNVSDCPGYTLGSLKENKNGLTAQLSLAGPACNAFGRDITNLTIQVTYESQTRLHVNIFDTDEKQFTVPESLVPRPASPTTSHTTTSDLIFNHEPSPFAFWITRRSDPGASPLFDTRISSLPHTPIAPVIAGDNSTALDGFPLVFEDQYLQLTSALPLGANIYGLGEVVASSGFRRDVGTGGGVGTIQTMWARDIADPIDQNVYGTHPIYLEHRFNESTNKSQSHGVFLLSAAGADILLLTPPSSPSSLVEYRMIGGVLDFYFFSGPTPQDVIEQYGALIGLPTWQPIWGFGFQLCRWGYHDINETREQVESMRAANIPLEVMWNDIDLYHAVRDFTSDPVSFPAEEVRAFTQELASNNQKYIPIVDAAVAKQVNATDIYDPYTRGVEQQVFITNPDGTEYIGQVWPGYTVFPDWFANNTEQWWTDALRNWSDSGVEFSGIWLDMNEASSFCDGSCGTGADLSNTSVPFLLPGVPGNLITDYPECYDAATAGPSGNITVNGKLTCVATTTPTKRDFGAGYEPRIDLNTPPHAVHNGKRISDMGADLSNTSVPFLLPVVPGNPFTDHPECYDAASSGPGGHIMVDGKLTCVATTTPTKRSIGIGAGDESGIDLNTPPYAIHNGNGRLSIHALATNATHAGGQFELDVHNLWGFMEERATHLALQDIFPGKRPFIIARSTFASSGKWAGHWLGDNYSKWQYMYFNIQGVLQFQLFQVPFVGADTCGFNDNTDEELCNRWMQLSAFTPFYRNHNIMGAISQEPYRWDSVANASRTAIAIRYSLLPYWYTLFANASTLGTPPVRALFFEFPDEPELFGVDRQFLIGRDILVTPVLTPNVSTVDGIFPGRGSVTWRDWYTHDVVDAVVGANTTLSAPLGHINVHIRDGAAILLHTNPAYTTTETRQGPYSLLVSQASNGHAFGSAYIDDGVSNPPAASTTLTFVTTKSQVSITGRGSFTVEQKLQDVTVLGVSAKPGGVTVQGKKVATWQYIAAQQKLVVTGLDLDLNDDAKLQWN